MFTLWDPSHKTGDLNPSTHMINLITEINDIFLSDALHILA